MKMIAHLVADARFSIHQVLRRVRYTAAVARQLRSGRATECTVCGYVGRFNAFGHPPRYGAECPQCKSLERHRLLKMAFDRHGIVRPGMAVLHFAPEPTVRRLLTGVDYSSADIMPGRADLVLDLEEIALESQSVDMVVANHVLEHVDDRKAMAELFRILRPGGVLIATVPIIEGWDESYEDSSITSGEQRLLHFGQSDHVRAYGRDFRDRLKGAGFVLDEFVATGSECVQYALKPGQRIFIGVRTGS
jgi:SAM-dependent methyltransferase